MACGESEQWLLEEITAAYRDLSGLTVWDVGAFIGFQALEFAQIVGPIGHVPQPRLRPRAARRPRRTGSVNSAQSSEELAASGIAGPLELHGHMPATEMPLIQATADLLFLPLAFSSPYPVLIRTSAPGKMGEYLAAGRPILVHAPPDSFVAWYCWEHECGVVVDRLDPRSLAAAVERFLRDEELRERLAARASERAAVDFDIRKARADFGRVVGLEPVELA